MSDPATLASLFDGAERAAMAGDYAAAARFLGDAARAQEAALGPDHLDLANTLNNLAVAHERCGQLDAAEREYRRAHAIASRVRPADDPIVTTSAQNLRDFCAAHGRPFDPAPRASGFGLALAPDEGKPAVTPVAPARENPPRGVVEAPRLALAEDPAPPPAMHAAASATPAFAAPMAPAPGSAPEPPATARPSVASPETRPRPARPSPPAPLRAPGPAAPVKTPAVSATTPARPAAAAPPAAKRPSVAILILLGAAAALVLWLLAGRGPAAPQAQPRAATPNARPTAAPPTPPAPARADAPAPAAARRADAPAGAASAAATPAGADGLTIGEAALCVSLSAGYRCQPAGATVAPGRLVFYTKLVAPRETSVVHRWYRGEELRQAVRLEVPARRQGFRTFSRSTVAAAGDWRVELRSRDGRLLHTERFTVR